ncbi:MAG: DUF438 domain-containing protein [Tissierellaceae bacterium]
MNIELKDIKMKELIGTDDEKIRKILDIKLDYLSGKTTLEEARELANSSFDKITGQEFVLSEQLLTSFGITDEEITDKLDEMLEIFADIRTFDRLDPPEGHPINTYIREVRAIRSLLSEMKEMLTKKFIRNPWEEIYEKLEEIKVHFARKQNQLYPVLEKKDFDKPTKVMWTLEDNIEAMINKGKASLKDGEEVEFLEIQKKLIDMIEEMMVKEEEILYPTSMNLITDQEFIIMRSGDDEIGYCLIDTPPTYKDALVKNENKLKDDFIKDLSQLLDRHGIIQDLSSESVLEVSRGQLTLEQINLIFKHLKIDLSYIDENEIVRFYTDTKHRIFPRSPGVIGREVQNCHPKESLDKVMEVIGEFREGRQDEAEFWIDTGEKFIYISFTAVRDEEGNFKGVLEMMQDVTRIRGLEGSQMLASWKKH